MRVKLEDLDKLLMRVRLTLLAVALFFLFVVPVPPLAVAIASCALLMRVLVLNASVQKWLVRNFVISSDRTKADDGSDGSRD